MVCACVSSPKPSLPQHTWRRERGGIGEVMNESQCLLSSDAAAAYRERERGGEDPRGGEKEWKAQREEWMIEISSVDH